MDSKIGKKTKLDLEQFLHLWFNVLPENHKRIKINVGQPEIVFPIIYPLTTNEVGLFSEPNGGNLLARILVTTSNTPIPISVDSGDVINFHINWSDF